MNASSWYDVLIGSGVAIAVYAFERGLLDSIIDFRKARSGVSGCILLYSQRIRTPTEDAAVRDEAAFAMRTAAAELISKWNMIWFSKFWGWIRIVPTEGTVNQAAASLNGLGLRIRMGKEAAPGAPDPSNLANEVCDLLKLPRQFQLP